MKIAVFGLATLLCSCVAGAESSGQLDFQGRERTTDRHTGMAQAISAAIGIGRVMIRHQLRCPRHPKSVRIP